MSGVAPVNPKVQFTSATGVPLVNGTVTVYLAGTTTKTDTWQDQALTTLNANPIQLNARGEATVWLNSTLIYKFVLANAGGVEQWTVDNIKGSEPAGTAAAVTASLAASGGSALVGFLQAGVNSVPRPAQAKMREWVSVADKDGANDTERLENALTDVVDGGVILLPPGDYTIASVDFTGKSVTLWGYGANVACTSATGAVYKTDHGNKLRVLGINFSGTGRAINHQSAPDASVSDDLDVQHCKFQMDGVYGIYCVGTREPRITQCNFEGTDGDGIYFKDCPSPFVSLCIFEGHGYTRRAVYYPGTGLGTDCGLVLRDCEMLGWDKGVEVIGTDLVIIDGCTIDYCNQSIRLAAQDRAIITNNYIGSLGATAALHITYDGSISPNFSDKIALLGNTFTGHYEGGSTYDCILIDGTVAPENIQIRNNFITFYTRYGINFTLASSKRLAITGNNFAQRTGFGVSPVYNSSGANDSGVVVKDNYFANSPVTITQMNLSTACTSVADNLGSVLRAKGATIVPSAASTVTVAHGITGFTPTSADVMLCPTNAAAATAQPFVSSVTATDLVINTVSAAGANAGVNYLIERRRI